MQAPTVATDSHRLPTGGETTSDDERLSTCLPPSRRRSQGVACEAGKARPGDLATSNQPLEGRPYPHERRAGRLHEHRRRGRLAGGGQRRNDCRVELVVLGGGGWRGRLGLGWLWLRGTDARDLDPSRILKLPHCVENCPAMELGGRHELARVERPARSVDKRLLHDIERLLRDEPLAVAFTGLRLRGWRLRRLFVGRRRLRLLHVPRLGPGTRGLGLGRLATVGRFPRVSAEQAGDLDVVESFPERALQ